MFKTEQDQLAKIIIEKEMAPEVVGVTIGKGIIVNNVEINLGFSLIKAL